MVNTPILGSRTLEQWLEEFTRLEKVNRELLKGTAGPAPEKKPGNATRRDWPGHEG
jgi:hypothetical protein